MIKLQEGEKIILEARKHWFVFLAEGILILIAVVLPAAVIVFSLWFSPSIREYFSGQIIAAVAFFWATWAQLAWIGFFIAWTNYYLDVLVVTDKRIMDIEQISLFRRDVVTVPLENIQDIKVEVIGVIPTLFKFGNLHIQTAGMTKEVLIKGLSRPTEIKDMISELYHKTADLPAGERSILEGLY